MVVKVRQIKNTKKWLELCGRQDFCVIKRIFESSEEQERKAKFLTSVLQLCQPCATKDQVKDYFQFFEEQIQEKQLQNVDTYTL